MLRALTTPALGASSSNTYTRWFYSCWTTQSYFSSVQVKYLLASCACFQTDTSVLARAVLYLTSLALWGAGLSSTHAFDVPFLTCAWRWSASRIWALSNRPSPSETYLMCLSLSRVWETWGSWSCRFWSLRCWEYSYDPRRCSDFH